ncbi:hypothetical protein ACFTS5_02330 [Nocardia sp. NPDC056952]|uniref:hypothetical protein n=1 Tax=Nocardia sp. NPDC056952 TaxID=3345979 RepID=UPI003626E47F
MAITDRDRKRLWGCAAGTCAVCQQKLFHEAVVPQDREALTGEEAHIHAQSPDGPRPYTGAEPFDLDGYDNLILLCRVHHRVVDEQTAKFTVKKLHEIKSAHEQWVSSRLQKISDEPAPIRLKAIKPRRGEPMSLTVIRTGREAWNVAAGCGFYFYEAPDEDEISDEAGDVAAEFLTNLRDWADLSETVTDNGFTAVMDAQRSLRDNLKELDAHGLVAFGGQRRMMLTGGIGQDMPVNMSIVVIRPENAVDDASPLVAVFADEVDLPS